MVLDDSYEPLRTVANTKQFLMQDPVFGLFGYVGTPTSNAVLPLLRKFKKPFIAPLTGSDLLRQSGDDFIASCEFPKRLRQRNSQRQLKMLVDEQGYKRIALFIQADEFGASVERNILQQFNQRKLTPIYTARFQRNSSDIYDSMTKLQQTKPDLVITVGTYSVISEAINWSAEQGFAPAYSILSFTGAVKLATLLEGKHKVYASAVLPWPLLKSQSQTDDIYLEGYQAASLTVAAVEACGTEITESCVLSALKEQQTRGYTKSDHHIGQDRVYMLQLTDDGFTLSK
ncbi:MAG: ABC transporter substrate-binding protein [Rheinheimera sp.]|nr:ABC transporter substrate-binding protein [Rheinheimera sp.]